MSSYITIAELKSKYPTVDYSAYTDAALNDLIITGSDKVDDFVGYSFDAETVTDEICKAFVDSDNSLVVFPKKYINSLTSLSIIKGSASVAITLTDGDGNNSYTIPTTKDRIILPVDDITLNSVDLLDFGTLRGVDFYSKITYTTGYGTIPVRVKEATALYVLDTIARSSNMSGATKVSQGGISMEYGSRLNVVDGRSDLVLDAERILNSYIKVSGW